MKVDEKVFKKGKIKKIPEKKEAENLKNKKKRKK